MNDMSYCDIIGHKWPRGYANGLPYLVPTTRDGYADGTGRTHYTLQARCDRCDEMFDVAKLHGPLK